MAMFSALYGLILEPMVSWHGGGRRATDWQGAAVDLLFRQPGWNEPMFRVLLSACAVTLLLLSSGAAYAQRESEERALRDQLADRDEYRAKLLLEVQRREVLLTKQKDKLAQQEKLLEDMRAKLNTPVSEDEEDAASSQTQGATPIKSVTGAKLKPDTVQAKRAKDFDSQVYKTMLARYDVSATQKDIADLRALLARHP